MLELAKQIVLPENREPEVICSVFNAEEAEAIKVDLESNGLHKAFTEPLIDVPIEYARERFRGLSLYGLDICVERLSGFVPNGFSKVFANWVSRPFDPPYKSKGRPKNMSFEVVTGPTEYRVGGYMQNNMHIACTQLLARPGDALRVSNLKRRSKRPVVSVPSSEGRRLQLRFTA